MLPNDLSQIAGHQFDPELTTEARRVTPGIQLALKQRGKPLRSWTWGYAAPGREMSTDTLFNVWCAVKPVVATTVLNELSAHGYAASDSVFDIVGFDDSSLAWLRDVSVGSLFTHEAALPDIGLFQAEMWGDERGNESFRVLKHFRPILGGHKPEYIEYTGSFLAELVLLALRDRKPRGLRLRRELKTGPQPSGNEEFGCYSVDASASKFLPHDLHNRFTSDRPYSLGGHASAAGLATWYDKFTDDPSQNVVGGFDRSLACGVSYFSRVFMRPVQFINGFIMNIGAFIDVPALSCKAYGHVGWNGASLGLVDPERGIAVGLVTNTCSAGNDRFFDLRRNLIDVALGAVNDSGTGTARD